MLTEIRRVLEEFAENQLDSDKHRFLLDYGCGNFPYRPIFEPKLDRYIASDLDGNDLADIVLGPNGEIPLTEDSVDIVLSNQVLEHVEAPNTYLREANRVLRPNGILLLSTHGVWKYHPDPLDLWRWTSEGLKREIEAAGFRLDSIRGILGPQATALQLWQDAVVKYVPSTFRSLFFRFVQWRISVADRRCSAAARDRDASVYLVVATKQ